MTLTEDAVRALPKVVLHDHLDGGLRPGTVLEIAASRGHGLPVPDTADAADLARWFADAADSGSLPRYLSTFEHTVAVMQTAADLERVAREAVEDLAADGAIHVELRFAPEQHTRAGLDPDRVVEAVVEGLRQGEVESLARGHTVSAGCIVTAMRQADHSLEAARLALRHRGRGVVGFDIAGPESGFPPTLHAKAFDLLRSEGFPFTIHAGEAEGIDSLRGAVMDCGAPRIGHGVRIADDMTWDDTGRIDWGPVAAAVRDRGVVLEVCPSSNLQTAAVPSAAAHPFGRLDRAGLAVTINTDNRLVSDTTMTREMMLVAEWYGYGIEDLRRFGEVAARAAFVDAERRAELLAALSPG